jgi:RHS repeat-associated protein
LVYVETSNDGIIWDNDAYYKYYEHGPLARVELGQQRVQGLDYAYTLQGWLKGVNANELDPAKDMGADGGSGINYKVAKDVFAFDLGYFSGDYVSIGGTGLTEDLNDVTSITAPYNSNNSLYNGNIKYMTTALADQTNTPLNLNLNLYNYDQLNRIRESHSYIGDNMLLNTFSDITLNTAYYSEYNYSENGNIEILKRNGDAGAMDDLVYTYYTGTNKLSHVDDGVNAGSYATDIDGQNVGNYSYDAIGNLVSDVTEEIADIKWTNSGKVKSIIRTAGSNMPDLAFSYDGMGNRILKIEKPKNSGVLLNQEKWVFTHYVRDAQGNIMATYEQKWDTPVVNANNITTFTETYILKEQVLYGSSRLGVRKVDEVLTEATSSHNNVNYSMNYNLDGSFRGNYTTINYNVLPTNLHTHTRGEKIYELSNHLGNVMATVSDKALPIDNDADGVIDFYNADLLSYSDYYPFGSLKPSRNANTSDYRFGFNGQEKDDEIKGSGNSINYLARVYDPRLGKFLSVDPLTKKFPMLTPYQFASNTPIQAIDLDGLEGLVVVKMDKPPTNFNKTVFAKELQQRLIESGAHKDTRVVFENSKAYNDIGAWNRFWDYESDQSATITIRDMNIVWDAGRTDAGGYGEDGQIVIYRGLVGIKNNAAKERELPTSTYVNVALHEIGHAVYDFFGKEKTDNQNGLGHDAKGDSKTGTDIMDYDAAYKKGTGFSDEQKEVIKEKAGEDEE